MCIMPVGDGAIRVTTGRSDIGINEAGEAAAPGARAAPLSTWIRRPPSLAAFGAWLADQAQAQSERWTLWTPVAFGLGAAAYFALPREPAAWVAAVLLALAGGLLLGSRRAGWRPLTVALALAAFAVAGFGLAKVRTERVWAPIAPAGGTPQRVEGWVVDVASPGQGGQRLLIAPARIGDWAAAATPIRIRVTLRPGAPVPAPGSPVSLLAIVNAPPPPASPGAYDFARDAFFESVGGVGFALGPPVTWTPTTEAPWRLRWRMQVNAVRWELSRRIVDELGPKSGGLAAAMTTGHEAFIPREQAENLRAAGLAHIISISGLHMAIVGGFAFAAARLLIAAWPWLALRVHGKKVAAVVGLAAVGGYLVLSGAPPPAERAAVTASVAFAAILVDRQAISLHALALAAMAVLLLQPEAVTEPGFQMSFAATAALVALAERLPRPVKEISVPWPIAAAQSVATWIGVSLAASFVAGLATGPFAMQHFNRVSTWGLAANLLVAPISSFLMMPGLALGAALTPFGLGEAPLAAAGFAIGLMNRVAATAAAAPAAQLVVASGPAWTLPAAFLGILWLCLWKGPLRWAGLPFALAVLLAPKPPAPDAWIAADGATAAVRSGASAVLLRPDVKLFGAELWARRRGLQPGPASPAAYDCDRWSCRPTADAPVRLAEAWNLKRPLKPGRIAAMCQAAEVLVIRNDDPPAGCRASLVLTGEDFRRGGSAELYRAANGAWRVSWAQDLRGHRPWTWGPDPHR
jgi:competence protein ComEC